MASIVINPRIRGFLCLTSHPLGCAANVAAQIAANRVSGPGRGIGTALVVGSSGGFGLSSLITTVFGYGAAAVAVCLERPGKEDRSGSAGFYNMAEVHRQARREGRRIETFNADAYAPGTKQQVIAALRERFAPVDTFIYSLASPKRTDPLDGTTYSSTLKPIGAPYTSKTINLDTDQVGPITIAAASEAEIAATVKVMGGEDWAAWVAALEAADLVGPRFRTVAYSYIGPQVTHAIYRAGTIGRAKDHLEQTARELHERLQRRGGAAYVSVNKALVTNASSAIPVVPLYISLLYQVMKRRGSHEGTCEQIQRLFATHLAPGRTPVLDAAGRIRMDDLEMDPITQAEVARLWETVATDNLLTVSDYAGFKHEFRALHGFEIPGIDYTLPVDTEASLA